MIRVTNTMMVSTVINNLQRNVSALEFTQNQISSGKRVTKPADDPAAATLGVRFRDTRASDNQYLRNIEESRSWLTATDQALDGVGDTLARIRELAVQGANDVLAPSDRAAIAREVDQLRDHLMDLFNNSVHVDQRIFSGTKTTTTSFTKNTTTSVVTYQGDSNTIQRETGPGSRIAVNVAGSTFSTMFSDLLNLVNGLTSASQTAIQTGLSRVDVAIDTTLSTRADIGAKLNRLDFTQKRTHDLELEVSRLQSANEDLDFSEAITRLTTQQGVYRAALEAGARTAPMSILDFLR
jgi:flagellar hook-associated protein 3 FlgL